jgi:hypothetical protein
MSVKFALLIGVFATCAVQAQSPPASAVMRADVERLVRAAGQLTDFWPKQPAPPLPEVATVARHGRAVSPLLMALLSDDPAVERDRPRWKAQQQAALALVTIYDSRSAPCGANYCDGDPPERIGHVRQGWVRRIAADSGLRELTTRELLDRFNAEKSALAQISVRDELARRGDRSIIPEIESRMTLDDRHLRGNAALILGRLGDPRGFETIVEILADRESRAVTQGIPGGNPTVRAQVRSDRYFAAHLLGDLRDPRGVAILAPLVNDDDVSYIVPWALAEIGGRDAVTLLVGQLESRTVSSSLRVLAVHALELLGAREALPKLRELLNDTGPSNFGEMLTVAEAARHAIAVISGVRGPSPL